MLVVHAAIKCDPHDIFIRADSRLYGSQSEAAMEPGIKAGFYAKNKRSTGDPNLRSLHNYGNRGVGDGVIQRLRCWRETLSIFPVTTLMPVVMHCLNPHYKKKIFYISPEHKVIFYSKDCMLQ